MNPWIVCVSVCLCVICMCVCMCLCVCLCVSDYLCLYVPLCMFICVCLCVSICLCVCLCSCVWRICLYDCVSENAFVCVCLCPHTEVGASLGLTLRGRGLPVHVYNPVAHLDQWYPVELSLIVAFVHPTKHHHTAFRPACVERREGGILGGQ